MWNKSWDIFRAPVQGILLTPTLNVSIMFIYGPCILCVNSNFSEVCCFTAGLKRFKNTIPMAALAKSHQLFMWMHLKSK